MEEKKGESLGTIPWGEELSKHYEILSSLGQGRFALVRMARHHLTNTMVAVKAVKDIDAATREVTVMQTLQHPNIIQLFQVLHGAKQVYIVMERGDGGDLERIIEKLGWLREEQAQRVFSQVLSAVDYCHSHGIAHRDIKPANILEAGEGYYKLCDFGLATNTTEGKKLKKVCGSHFFCAPEVLRGRPYDGFAADMWSLGAVLYLLVTGRLPYDEETSSMQEFMICATDFSIPSHLSAGITHVLAHLLGVSPRLRPSASRLLEHPWVKSVTDRARPSVRDVTSSIPNPTILGAMCQAGFKPLDVVRCLDEKVYNEVLSTYLMMNHQAVWRDIDEKVGQAEVEAGVMSPSGFPSPPPPRRSQSEPGLSKLARPTPHRQLRAKRLRKPWGRAVSTPPALWFPWEPAPPQEPLSTLSMRSSVEGREGSLTSKLSSSSSICSYTKGQQEKAQSWASRHVTPQPTQAEPTPSTSVLSRGWRRVTRRLLCCCRPPESPTQDSLRTVAATHGEACQDPRRSGKPWSQAGSEGDSGRPRLGQRPPSFALGDLSPLDSSGQELLPGPYRRYRSDESRGFTPNDAQSQRGLARRTPSPPLVRERSELCCCFHTSLSLACFCLPLD